MSEIEIVMQVGVIQGVVCPPGARLRVRDYDVDADDARDPSVVLDDEGTPYRQSVWQNEG